ncbi:SMP-30/gluconolactonase/LRE family protein [Microlunatus ginsengisoli]|uniref:SMP-30/Gluconolactonase/LRE-like region domain-containing protein n=1 Tax=Microlunatus ginsengisoli TaxID=363863 RepID=A0ABP6ZVG8_9ACTN
MTRSPRTTAFGALVASAVLLAPALSAPTAEAHPRPHQPTAYVLSGDPGGSKFEGIGYDRRSADFYVSETTGGEIHRGNVGRAATTEWLAGDGTDGRYTARGVTVDRAGRVYVAGGPNGIDHPGAPDLWVYDRGGRLLTALSTGRPNVFLNDVAIGPDGAAYFTDTNTPRIFRLARGRTGWQVGVWSDASGTVAQGAGFNFNGIVATADRRALLVVQSNTGILWRFDLRSRQASRVDTGSADLTSGDGLVLRGHRLSVVRNFPRRLVTLDLSRHWRVGTQVADVATPPDRVLTTAKIARGRLLAVDSKFDETVAQPPYEVIVLPLP